MSRKFTMSPIEPRTAGSLKGFGFTVTWGDDQSTARGNDGAERVDTPSPLTQQGFATPDGLGNEVGRPQSATLQSETVARASYSRDDTAVPVDTLSPADQGGEDSGTLDSLSASNDDFATIPHLGPVA
jgi:hypothetical protein